jgi:pimeloyl-ACP methyl ester carboxylesterase
MREVLEVTPALRSVGEAELEVTEWGSGEPLVFVQTALTADELLPVAGEDALGGYRKIVYHRRGYAGSSPAACPGSVPHDAADCARLLTALSIDRAHIVGFSYSGAVALELAATEPQRVSSLALIEPPPVHTASAVEFREANERLMQTRDERGPAEALDQFLSLVIGPGWRTTIEHWLPESSRQMERDAATFFDCDMPALLSWNFGSEDARRITCPVMHIGGADSGPWFAQVRELMLDWFPHADDVVIAGADHDLPLTHSADVARAIAGFLDGQRPSGVTGDHSRDGRG